MTQPEALRCLGQHLASSGQARAILGVIISSCAGAEELATESSRNESQVAECGRS